MKIITFLATFAMLSFSSFSMAKSKENIQTIIADMPTHVRAFMSSDLTDLEININKYAKSGKLTIVNSSISYVRVNDRDTEFTALVTFKR